MALLDDPTLIVATLGLLGTVGVAFLNTRIENRLTRMEMKTFILEVIISIPGHLWYRMNMAILRKSIALPIIILHS